MSDKKTLYHSELVKMGTVEVEITSDVTPSKYKDKPPYVGLKIDGADRLYNTENQECEDFFANRKGDRLVIVASGTREDAVIEEGNPDDLAPPTEKRSNNRRKPADRESAPRDDRRERPEPDPKSQPKSQPKDSQPKDARPTREQLNNPAWGVYNLRHHLMRAVVATEFVLKAAHLCSKQYEAVFGHKASDEQVRAIVDRLFISVEKAGLLANLPAKLDAPASAEPSAKRPDPEPRRESQPAAAAPALPPEDDDVPF